ncbi:hypothetical protein [Cellulophaga sp. Hel_I_12]|uniref:hypothetical protein n=1 Tax=Cellulophaga sp. Hel_I_12 TaxID=1249972 RepID=UPI000645FA54|nr:hypothetical protein [Cellulophaga sp. Hel_I_12]
MILLKNSILIFLILAITGCANSVSETQLNQLNGYWEIEKVSFPDGQTKEYTINETVDYIQLDSLTGFRKKMKPTFEGTYITSDDAELFTIFKLEDSYIIQYKANGSMDWTENLIAVSANSFSVRTSENVTYTYKRYEPINITE